MVVIDESNSVNPGLVGVFLLLVGGLRFIFYFYTYLKMKNKTKNLLLIRKSSP